MSSYKLCEQCCYFHFDNQQCEEYTYDTEQWGEGSIFALSYSQAAERLMKTMDVEHKYMNEKIEVSISKDGITKKFNVFEECDITFDATEIECSESEVWRKYFSIKNPLEQLQIGSELNVVSKEDELLPLLDRVNVIYERLRDQNRLTELFKLIKK